MNSFAERLRFARKLRGLNQSELAAACKLSQSAIANYEAGSRRTTKQIFRIADVLNVSAAWLAEGVEPMEFTAPSLTGNVYRLAEQAAQHPTAAWPFKNIAPEVYWSLSEDDRNVMENTMAALIASLLQRSS